MLDSSPFNVFLSVRAEKCKKNLCSKIFLHFVAWVYKRALDRAIIVVGGVCLLLCSSSSRPLGVDMYGQVSLVNPCFFSLRCSRKSYLLPLAKLPLDFCLRQKSRSLPLAKNPF